MINVPNRYIGQRFISEVEAYADSHDLHLYQGLKQMPVTVPYLKGYIRDFITLLDPLIKDAAKLEPSELIYILREGLDYDKFQKSLLVGSFSGTKPFFLTIITHQAHT